jgi:tetratricopeptide (TPR) repeat protein
VTCVDAIGNKALALKQLGRTNEALATYARLEVMRPKDPQPPFNQAVLFRELGRVDEALFAVDRALKRQPDLAEAHRARAVILNDLFRSDEALAAADRALALAPATAEALYDRGCALLALGRAEEALASFDAALELRPAYAEALNNRGSALNLLRRYDEALASYDAATELKPDYAEAFCNRALPLRELRRFDEALQSCDRALALQPAYAEAQNNRAGALYDLRRVTEAVTACDAALALRPDLPDAHNNRAVMQLEGRRLTEARAGFEHAVELSPAYAEAHYNLAMTRLMMGDAEGWSEYEWRWKTRQFEFALRDLGAPLWLGEDDLRGRSILLHGEQGLGDVLQFCRYAPLVAERGAVVVLEVLAGLERLAKSLAGVSEIVVRGHPLPAFDFQTPLLSLPLALGAGLHPPSEPYLAADPVDAAAWGQRLAADRNRRIGLCWAGGMRPDQPVADAMDKRRSLSLEVFAPFASLDGISLYSLQKGPPAGELAELVARDWNGPPIVDLTGELTDFADTAALVANLDLVITCDTAVAHLAGALGKPVWILNRFDACWRWLDGRDDSPWYPTARLFGQPEPGDWASVISAVASALQEA